MTGIEPVPFSWLFVGLLISWRLPKSHTCATLCYTVFTRPKRNMAAFLLGLHFHIRETHDLFLRDGTKYVRRSGWKIFKEVKLDARFRWILSACYYCYYSMLNILRLTPAETRYVRFTHRIRFDSTTFSGTISRFGTSLALKVWRCGIQTQQLCNWTMIQSAATNPPWTNLGRSCFSFRWIQIDMLFQLPSILLLDMEPSPTDKHHLKLIHAPTYYFMKCWNENMCSLVNNRPRLPVPVKSCMLWVVTVHNKTINAQKTFGKLF